MKKPILLSVLLLSSLMVSCGENTGSQELNSSAFSSIEISSEDPNLPKDTLERIDFAIEQLTKINGHAKKTIVEQTSTLKLISDSGTFDMSDRTIGEGNRYIDENNRSITILDSYWSVLDDRTGKYGSEEKCTMQTTYDDQYFYSIYDYEDDSEDYLVKMPYNDDLTETVMDFGFGNVESMNLETLKQFVGLEDFECEINGLKEIKDGINTDWALEYKLTQYEPLSTAIKMQITYKDYMVIEDGKIIEASQELENALYAAGQKGNWKITNSSFSFEHGDYDKFTGVLLNPNDFHEKEDPNETI